MHQFSIPGSLVVTVAIIQVQRRADVAVTALLQRLQDGKTHWYSFSDVPMIYTQEIAVFLQEGVNFFKQNLLTQLMSERVLCYVEQLWHHMTWKQMIFAMGNPREIRKEVLAQLCEVYIHRPKVTVDVTKCLPYGWLIINRSNESPVFGSNDDFHLRSPTTTLTWTALYIGWSSNACWHWSAYNKPDNRMFGLLVVWLLNRIKFIFDVSWNFHGQCAWDDHMQTILISAFGCLSSLSLVQNSIFWSTRCQNLGWFSSSTGQIGLKISANDRTMTGQWILMTRLQNVEQKCNKLRDLGWEQWSIMTHDPTSSGYATPETFHGI